MDDGCCVQLNNFDDKVWTDEMCMQYEVNENYLDEGDE